MPVEVDHWQQVNKAFGKQSVHFDEEDFANPVLQAWRKRIYAYVDRFLKPNSKILELNAGTGIDAIRFAQHGHAVHATDLSDGMIAKLKEKVLRHALNDKITIQQVSFEHLDQVHGKFDYVFSNFGGLNCIDDLSKVARYLPNLLNENSFVTWAIMPRVCPWEWAWVLKGEFKKAFRRLSRKGTLAHLEGEIFMTYYYSVDEIKKALGPRFQLVRSEGLGLFSPPPTASAFVKKYPRLTKFLNSLDHRIRNWFPFNRWGDHVVVTFKYDLK